MQNVNDSFRALYYLYIEIADGKWYKSYQALQHFVFLFIFILWILKPNRTFTKTFSLYFAITSLAVCGAMNQIKQYVFAIIFFLLSLVFLYDTIKGKSVYIFQPKRFWIFIFLIIGFWYPIYTKNPFLSPYGLLPQPTLLVILSVMLLSKRKISRISSISVLIIGSFFGIYGFFYLKSTYDLFLMILVPIFFIFNLRKTP
ncbi:MAG: hypothetical protein A2539_08965 [Elusimicrobia bacterium RIFOXYD2_FULL_34_15]|nr:MAG: hypothetical protein A2539_08965 [Elusimicrobia bacterium RIFOXYD2_FULL_34_15]